MNPTRHLLGLLAGTAFLNPIPALGSAQVNEAITPPNIIFFLVDDLGWTDINATEGTDGQLYDNPGGEYDSGYYYTPNLAKLLNESMRFTNAYAACPFCGPLRASVLGMDRTHR